MTGGKYKQTKKKKKFKKIYAAIEFIIKTEAVINNFTLYFVFFFFNDTATTEIYTLSLHDALPIFVGPVQGRVVETVHDGGFDDFEIDRKSTRLNSSHDQISYAVFCLKKKKKK